MPFNPPQQQNDPLEILLKLQALRQNQDQIAIDQRNQTLRTVMGVIQGGGDPSSLLGQLDPATARAAQSIVAGQRQMREQDALQQSLNPQAINPYAQAISPIADASGNVTPPSPEDQQSVLDTLSRRLDALNLPPNLKSVVLDSARIGAQGAGRAATEQVAGERRQAATVRGNAAYSAGLQEAAAKRAEQRQIRAEQRATSARDADEFAQNAAIIMQADPGRQPDLIKQATERFGPDAARALEYRLANTTEAAGAKISLDKQAAQRQVEDVLSQGKTSDPFVAKQAVAGKAGFDPTTQFYYPGADSTTERYLSGLSSVYEIQAEYEKAAQLFAENSGGKVYSGTLQEISKKVGAGNPYLTAMQILGERYRTNLSFLKSGANVPPEEFNRLEAANPDTAQLNIVNGQLTPSAAVSFAANKEELESLYLSRFSRADRGAVRSSLRDFAGGRITELANDPNSWLVRQAAPTTKGAEIVQRIRDISDSQPPQPGTR